MRGDQDSSAPRPRLAELAVEDLGVIARAVIEPAPGLTAITGETGAGKTMLLAALDLLRGGRADLAVIRSGADRALATGVLSLPSGHPVLDLAAEMAATTDDDELVLTRTVSPSRSRAIAGGCPVPASGLARLTEDLVAVHGQADQRRLTSPAEQRDILDTYAGPAHLAALATYRETFAAASDLRARIERMTHASREDRVRADELSRGLAEIRAAAPRPGEEEQVTAEIDRLTHSEGLTRAVSLTQARLVGAEDAGLGGAGLGGADLSEGAALSHIDAARRSLSNAAQLDPELEQIAERLADLHYQLQDVSGEVGSYLASLEPDPARLESLHERRSVLNSLVRRYGPTLSDVLTWAEEAENALMDLDAGEDAIAERRAELVALEGELAAQAAVVSQGRREAATQLSTAVEVEL
ncbi:MAG: AAA family ATPase, partial [Micrococcales bacterium]|nr:AAA family ATPase [Micrococcales bacterium]